MLLPFKLQAKEIKTNDCGDGRWLYCSVYINTDDDADAINNTRINGINKAISISPLQNFTGNINKIMLNNVSISAPQLNFKLNYIRSDNRGNWLKITNSNIRASMNGDFYYLDFVNSALDGNLIVLLDKNSSNEIKFDNASVTGNIVNNAAKDHKTGLDLTFKNNSTLKGDILLNNSFTSSDTSVLKTSSINVSFADSTWYGGFQDIAAPTNSKSVFTFIRSKVNPDNDRPTEFNFIHGSLDFTLDDSQLNANLTTQTKTGKITLKNNSTLGTISLTRGIQTINVSSNSSIDSIQIQAGDNTINLTDSTLGKAGQALNNPNVQSPSSAIFLSGVGAGYTLNANNSIINGYIYSDAYNTFTVKAINSTFNGKKDPESVLNSSILNYYGHMKNSSFDNSIVNGDIVWAYADFASDTKNEGLDEGLVFKNNSVLNGDIHHLDRPYGNWTASFLFENSTMNGNIIDSTSYSTTNKDESGNWSANDANTNVMFRKSALNGDVSVSSKGLNAEQPSIVKMNLGFWQSNFNFNTITNLSDDVTSKPQLNINLNEAQMIGKGSLIDENDVITKVGGEIKNQGDLVIKAGWDSHIITNITSGIADDGSDMANSTFTMYLDNYDRIIAAGQAVQETNADEITKKGTSDKLNRTTDTTKRSSYTGRLITNTSDSGYDKAKIYMQNSDLTLLSGSSAFIGLNAGGDDNNNTLTMQNSLLRLTNKSVFNGTLNALGSDNTLEFYNSTFTLSDNSSFQGVLKSNFANLGSKAGTDAENTINFASNTAFVLKPNATSSDMSSTLSLATRDDTGKYTITDNRSNALALSTGFKGNLYGGTTTDSYLEMDSSKANNEGDAVVLILKAGGSAAKPNLFQGTLNTKGTSNYLYLDNFTTFNLNDGSFFDGVLLGNSDSVAFNNPNGDIVLEEGSYFAGRLQANTLTLKGASFAPTSSSSFKSLQVRSGVNTISNITIGSLTSPILNNGGVLNMNFIGSDTDPTKAIPTAFRGAIYTYGGESSIDFVTTLYADPNGSTILASGNGKNFISYDSDLATLTTPNANTATILQEIAASPNHQAVFNVYTQDNALNALGLSGDFSAKANIHYDGGDTYIVLADSYASKSTDKTPTDSLDIGNNSFEKYSIGTINGRVYQDGLVIAIDGSKANEVLENYRDIYPSNLATLAVDKTSAKLQKKQEEACKADASKCLPDNTKLKNFLQYNSINPDDPTKASYIYKATLEGILVGDVTSLAPSYDPKNPPDNLPIYEATLGSRSAFIGNLQINNTSINLTLSQGSKLILTGDSTLGTLNSSASFINEASLGNASLTQRNNTIIDLATNADLHNLTRKDNYSTLTIKELRDVSNVVFKLSFGKDPSKDDALSADKLVVEKAINSTGNYLEVYQNLSHPTTLKEGEKVLLASIVNEGGNTAVGKIFKAGKVVNNEGFDVITSNIEVFDSNYPDKVTTGQRFSNYYLTSISSSINQDAANISKSALNSNRTILLSNINDINKRMGELRNNPSSQGAWARVFNGMSSSDYGVSLKNIFTNVQVGYDYSLGNLKDASQYLGVTVSYGYNVLSSNGADLKGNANSVELGLYYAYVADSGFYSDSILKYGFINNRLATGQSASINYNTNAITFGQEVGYRFFLDKAKRFYIDPLAEVNVGYFGDGKISQIKGEAFLNASMDASLLYRVKLGGNMGYRLITSKNETDFRAGLSYVLDGSTGIINMQSNLSSQSNSIPLSNTGVLQLGVNSVISDKWRAYLDVDVGFGSKIYRQDYLVSIGGRYLFGKKSGAHSIGSVGNANRSKEAKAKEKEAKAAQALKAKQEKELKAKEAKALKEKQAKEAKEAKAAQALKAKQEKAAKAKSSSKAQPTKAQPSKSQSNKGGK